MFQGRTVCHRRQRGTRVFDVNSWNAYRSRAQWYPSFEPNGHHMSLSQWSRDSNQQRMITGNAATARACLGGAMIDCESGIGCDHGSTETSSHGGRPKTIVLTGCDHRSTETSSGGGATKMCVTTSGCALGYRAFLQSAFLHLGWRQKFKVGLTRCWILLELSVYNSVISVDGNTRLKRFLGGRDLGGRGNSILIIRTRRGFTIRDGNRRFSRAIAASVTRVSTSVSSRRNGSSPRRSKDLSVYDGPHRTIPVARQEYRACASRPKMFGPQNSKYARPPFIPLGSRPRRFPCGKFISGGIPWILAITLASLR
jgi:hypothetical protein